MRTIPYDQCPPGQALIWLEAGDQIAIHEGEVLVTVYAPPDNAHYTLTSKDNMARGYTPATPAHHNCMIEGGGQRDK